MLHAWGLLEVLTNDFPNSSAASRVRHLLHAPYNMMLATHHRTLVLNANMGSQQGYRHVTAHHSHICNMVAQLCIHFMLQDEQLIQHQTELRSSLSDLADEVRRSAPAHLMHQDQLGGTAGVGPEHLRFLSEVPCSPPLLLIFAEHLRGGNKTMTAI